MKKNKITLLLAVSVALLPLGARAQIVLAEFTFESAGSLASSDTSLYSTVTDWDVSNSDRDGGTDLAAIENTTFTGDYVSVQSANNTPPTAFDAYQSFTLTITGLGAGETVNLTDFDFRHSSAGSALGFNSNVFSSLTGLASNSLGGLPSTNGNFDTLVEIDLSANAAFTGLTNGTAIEFRIALRDGSGSGTRYHGLDDISVTGTVVPEPSTFALLGLGMMSLIARRRYRHL